MLLNTCMEYFSSFTSCRLHPLSPTSVLLPSHIRDSWKIWPNSWTIKPRFRNYARFRNYGSETTVQKLRFRNYPRFRNYGSETTPIQKLRFRNYGSETTVQKLRFRNCGSETTAQKLRLRNYGCENLGNQCFQWLRCKYNIIFIKPGLSSPWQLLFSIIITFLLSTKFSPLGIGLGRSCFFASFRFLKFRDTFGEIMPLRIL